MENVATKVAEPQTALPQKKIRHYGVTMRYVDALIALCPVVIWSFLAYGVYAIRNVLLSVVTMILAEFVFVFIKNRKVLFAKDATKKSLKEILSPLDFLAPAISGTIFGLMVPVRETDPAGMVYFYLIVSALFGIILGKLVFGGTGRNIFNPAATAFVFMLVCFQSKFSGAYHWNAWGLSFLDSSASVTSNATALSLHSASTPRSARWREECAALRFRRCWGFRISERMPWPAHCTYIICSGNTRMQRWHCPIRSWFNLNRPRTSTGPC